jgi:LmbE family N-acetylglucosaminyl deacetylase
MRLISTLIVASYCLAQAPPRIEDLRGKTILLFTPHPDDDTFCCAGTLALLAPHNAVHIVIYTNDDKGSYDPDMSSERLARIRKAEEEESCRILGIPKENIHWLGHHDGMLEYVNPKDLAEQATAIIRKLRPDVVFSIDPGAETVRWHKTDHRMAAMNTMDAVRAAEWHLYFPNQRLQQGLEPWIVPLTVYYYVTAADANYWAPIDSVLERKVAAAAAHVSQFEPSIRKYRPDWNPADLEKLKSGMRSRVKRKNGVAVEAFRVSREFNQQ